MGRKHNTISPELMDGDDFWALFECMPYLSIYRPKQPSPSQTYYIRILFIWLERGQKEKNNFHNETFFMESLSLSQWVNELQSHAAIGFSQYCTPLGVPVVILGSAWRTSLQIFLVNGTNEGRECTFKFLARESEQKIYYFLHNSWQTWKVTETAYMSKLVS